MSSPKILIIEDDETYQSLITRSLVKEGFIVYQARNAEQGSVYAFQIQPDLILCDVVMDKGDGFNVLSRLRSDPRTSSVPIIIMTGWGSRGGHRQAMSLGADDYLHKPFTANELITAIRARIKRTYIQTAKSTDEFKNLRRSISQILPQELRSPLTTILGFSHLLQEETSILSQEEISDIAQQITTAGNHIDRMSRNIACYGELTHYKSLDASRAVRSPCTTSALTQAIRSSPLLHRHQHRIQFDLPECRIACESDYLERALIELIHNAALYSDDGASIYVVAAEKSGNIVLCVKNRGIGFTTGELARISPFMRFERPRLASGLGLGIAIAKMVCDVYGGSFSIDTEGERTVRVFMSLPVDA